MALSATTVAAPAAFLSSSSSSPSLPAVRLEVSVHAGPACRCLHWTSPPPPPPPMLISLPCSSRGVSRRRRLPLQLLAAVAGYQAVEKEDEGAAGKGGQEGGDDKRRKLYVVNLPWDFAAPDIRDLFGQCGTVKDVEIIKQKNGKSRGFAFITMSSAEEARAVIEKFDSYELQERIIRVEFAKSMKKPSSRPAGAAVETRHKIYVSNLAWKARSSNLREFFSAKFKPISARVVFNTPSGKTAGYGFVSFATKEEMKAAISEFDGKGYYPITIIQIEIIRSNKSMSDEIKMCKLRKLGPKRDDDAFFEAVSSLLWCNRLMANSFQDTMTYTHLQHEGSFRSRYRTNTSPIDLLALVDRLHTQEKTRARKSEEQKKMCISSPEPPNLQ